MIKFIKLRDPENHFDNNDIIMRTDEETLTEILEDLTSFIKSCGYSFNGEIGIINEELEEEEKD